MYRFIFILFLFVYSVFSDNVLILRPEHKNFLEIEKGIKDELDTSFVVKSIVINKKSDIKIIDNIFKDFKPDVIVLMDNTSVNLYKKFVYSKAGKEYLEKPVIACAGAFINQAVDSLPNSVTITYEVPIVTSVRSFRNAFKCKADKIGVIHRNFLNEFVSLNKKYCAREKITVVNREITKNNVYKELKAYLKEFLEKERVDAIWVPNDNKLLTPYLIKYLWIPYVKKYKIPLIVGVKVLVDPSVNMGVFAVLPDNISLGGQVAQKIYDIKGDNYELSYSYVEPPISVVKIVNWKLLKYIFNVDEKTIPNVDEILK